MDREEFYRIIEGDTPSSLHEASASAETLESRLSVLPDDSVLAFALQFNRELVDLNSWDVWGAGYVALGGMSDDAFRYFRSWLIGKGKQTVDSVRRDPDSLADFLDGSRLDNEELEYAAITDLERRGILVRYEREIDVDADQPPEGQPFEEESVESSYPRVRRAVSL